MTENVSLIVAFGGGLVSFLSPCVLPMVPVYLASLYRPEISGVRARLPALLHSLSFVIGFSIVFVALGAVVGFSGRAIVPDYYLLGKIAGGLLVFFGVFILLSARIPWLNFEKRLAVSPGKATGYLRSLVIGAAFSLGWTACVAPVLGSILAIAAVRATAWEGALLLAVFSLGLGLPFLALGLAFDSLKPWLKRLNRYSGIVRIISGLLLIAIGVLMLAGKLAWISSLAG